MDYHGALELELGLAAIIAEATQKWRSRFTPVLLVFGPRWPSSITGAPTVALAAGPCNVSLGAGDVLS